MYNHMYVDMKWKLISEVKDDTFQKEHFIEQESVSDCCISVSFQSSRQGNRAEPFIGNLHNRSDEIETDILRHLSALSQKNAVLSISEMTWDYIPLFFMLQSPVSSNVITGQIEQISSCIPMSYCNWCTRSSWIIDQDNCKRQKSY